MISWTLEINVIFSLDVVYIILCFYLIFIVLVGEECKKKVVDNFY